MRHLRYLMVMTVCGIGAVSAARVFAQSLHQGWAAGRAPCPVRPVASWAGERAGGRGGAMGQMLPSLSSSSTGNVAGVLGYCVKNNIVQGSSATGALSALTGKSGVTSSSGYTAGEQGQIQSGNGNQVSLNGASRQIKTKACDMVLQHAQSLL